MLSLKLRNYSSRLTLLIVVSSCSSSEPLIKDTLDPMTGATVTHADVPFVFYRDNSSTAAHAREFIHLGPVQVNRMGQYRYFLWLGAWSTMQSGHLSEQMDGLESLIVIADGEPMPLMLAGWTPDSIGASESVYMKPAASLAEAYYEVTVDQLRFIAGASDIRLLTTALKPASYEAWDDQATARHSLAEFVDYVAP